MSLTREDIDRLEGLVERLEQLNECLYWGINGVSRFATETKFKVEDDESAPEWVKELLNKASSLYWHEQSFFSKEAKKKRGW